MEDEKDAQEEYSDPGEVAQEEQWTDENDPWGRREQPDPEAQHDERAQSSQGDGTWSGYRPGTSGNYTSGSRVGVHREEQSSAKLPFDNPPKWDGKDPAKNLTWYLKSLKLWLATTRTAKTQQGAVLLQFAEGELRKIIDEKEIDELTTETGGQLVYDHIEETFEDFKVKKLPQAMDELLFLESSRRHKGESMLDYTQRKKTLFQDLDKAKCVLPSLAKGYILLKDAKLSDKARDVFEGWTEGEYEYDKVFKNLRKLERPIPGTGGTTLMGLHGFAEMDAPPPGGGPSDPAVYHQSDQETPTFWTQSLYLDPDDFTEEQSEQVLKEVHNSEILYVAGDIPDDVVLEETEAVAILANYGQVRQYLHKKTLGRGFQQQKPPKGGGKAATKAGGARRPAPKGGNRRTAPPKKWSKAHLMARSKCARCGKMGHWARDCKNPPDERGKSRMASISFMSSHCLSLHSEPPPKVGKDKKVRFCESFNSAQCDHECTINHCGGPCVHPPGHDHGTAEQHTCAAHEVTHPIDTDKLRRRHARHFGSDARIVVGKCQSCRKDNIDQRQLHQC